MELISAGNQGLELAALLVERPQAVGQVIPCRRVCFVHGIDDQKYGFELAVNEFGEVLGKCVKVSRVSWQAGRLVQEEGLKVFKDALTLFGERRQNGRKQLCRVLFLAVLVIAVEICEALVVLQVLADLVDDARGKDGFTSAGWGKSVSTGEKQGE